MKGRVSLPSASPSFQELREIYKPELWDGYRCLATIRGDQLDLRSRHGTVMTGWFEQLGDLARHVGCDAVLDGEVVALDAEGRPEVYALRRVRPTFVAFDVLAIAGRDVTALPLRARRELLAELVPDALPLSEASS